MDHLKIIQVLPDLNSGGVERGTLEIASYLQKNNVKNFVCSNGGPLLEQLKKMGIKHIKLPVHTKNPLMILKNIYHLAILIKRYNINIIHARSRAPAWSCYFVAKLMRIKFVTTFHSAYSASHPLKRFYNSIMLKGDKVIVVSNYVKKHIETRYRFTSDKLQIVDRGVDLEIFNEDNVTHERIEEVRCIIGLEPNNDKLIILPARFTRAKGHLYLIKALKYVMHQNYKCLIIGKALESQSSYISEIKQLINDNNLNSKIILIDQPISDMPALYKISDIVVSASIEPEGFGRTIIEAQAMNRVVISTNIGAPYDLIKHNKNGFLIPTSDPATFAEIIDYILNMSESEKNKITTKARSSVKKNYSLNEMCKKTYEIYKDLINDE